MSSMRKLVHILGYAYTVLYVGATGTGYSYYGGNTGGAGSMAPPAATSDSNQAKMNNLAALSQGQMATNALARAVSGTLDYDALKGMNIDMSKNPLCSVQGVEGGAAAVKQEQVKQCFIQKQQKRRAAQTIANKLIEGPPKPKECVVKYDVKAAACNAEKVMNNIIGEPYYKLRIHGSNVVILNIRGRDLLMGVVEGIHYQVKPNEAEPQSCFKDSPEAEYTFNVLGNLLDKKGELPKSTPKEDDFSDCIQKLAKKVAAVEGKVTACGGCNSSSELAGLTRGNFKVDKSSKGKKDDEENEDEDKKKEK